MRKYAALNGLLIAIVSIFGAFLIEGGALKALFLIAPLLIVFGGTFAAAIIGFGYDKVKDFFKFIKIAYFPPEYNLEDLVETFYQLALKARKQGLLVLEDDVENIDNFFTRKMLRFMIDGLDNKSLEEMAELEMLAIEDRHNSNISMFSKMGGYAPTMGILGTVMALIMTLANAGTDPNILIRSIASAFIATLWGVLSANLFWLPISDKLRECHQKEKLMMEMGLEGTLALQNGEIPMLLRSKLIAMLPQKNQKHLMS
jgi:chemotaxis protein MotA